MTWEWMISQSLHKVQTQTLCVMLEERKNPIGLVYGLSKVKPLLLNIEIPSLDHKLEWLLAQRLSLNMQVAQDEIKNPIDFLALLKIKYLCPDLELENKWSHGVRTWYVDCTRGHKDLDWFWAYIFH